MTTRESQLHKDLQTILQEAQSIIPGLTCTCSHRGQADQDKAFAEGKSKVKYPGSKHNSLPARAMDLAIIRKGVIDWGSTSDWYFIAGVVLALSKARGIPVRWGGDFNSNLDFKDDRWDDLPHFELEG